MTSTETYTVTVTDASGRIMQIRKVDRISPAKVADILRAALSDVLVDLGKGPLDDYVWQRVGVEGGRVVIGRPPGKDE